jgi:hypothetical protein
MPEMVEPLLQHWPYFYERSIGCIGVLKDWLIRAVAASLADEAANNANIGRKSEILRSNG